MARKKSALDEALGFIGNTASNFGRSVGSTLGNTVNTANNFIKGGQSFVNTFSQDFDNYQKIKQQQEKAAQQQAFNWAKSGFNFVNKVNNTKKSSLSNYFNATKDTNPYKEGVQNFWTSRPARALGDIQNRVETGHLIGEIKLPTKLKSGKGDIFANALEMGVNIPGYLINSVYGQGVTAPTADVTKLLLNPFRYGTTPQYKDLNSGVTKLGLQLGGIINPSARETYGIGNDVYRPQEFIGNVAQSVNPIIDAWGGGQLFKIARTGFTGTGKQILSGMVRSGINALPPGFASVGAQTLNVNRNEPTVTQQVTKSAMETALAAPFIFVGGMAFHGLGAGAAKIAQKFGPKANNFLINKSVIADAIAGNVTAKEKAQLDRLNNGVDLNTGQGPVWDFLRDAFPQHFDQTGRPLSSLVETIRSLNAESPDQLVRIGKAEQAPTMSLYKTESGQVFSLLPGAKINPDGKTYTFNGKTYQLPVPESDLGKPLTTITKDDYFRMEEEALGNKPEQQPEAITDITGQPAVEPQFRTTRNEFGNPVAPGDALTARAAIQYLKSAVDIEDFMSPQYSKAEQVIRELAGDYLGRDVAKRPINDVIKLMAERLQYDQPETVQLAQSAPAQIKDNLLKDIEQNPTVQAIKDEMNKAEQFAEDTKGQVVDKGENSTAPQPSDSFNMAVKDAEGAVKSMLSDVELEYVNGGKKLVTPEGNLAKGKYYNSVLSVLEQDGKVESETVYHEAFHAYADRFANPQLYSSALKEVIDAEKVTQKKAAEILAEGFAEWMQGRTTPAGTVLSFFQDFLFKFRELIGKVSSAEMMYHNLASGKAQGEGPGIQVGITSAQAASPITAQIIDEGTKLFESGRIDEGLAKLQEATSETLPEFNDLLIQNGVEVRRLETNTHGLYFGTPEPSYWAQFGRETEPQMLKAVAQFAKDHGQESFITAKISNTPEAKPGLTLNFGRELSNQEILAVEKIANEQGLGLTLNQKTGEAKAYNVSEFDGMAPEQFVQAATNTRDALLANGLEFTSRIDKYDVKVYNNAQYDGLINGNTTEGQHGELNNPVQSDLGAETGAVTPGGRLDSSGLSETPTEQFRATNKRAEVEELPQEAQSPQITDKDIINQIREVQGKPPIGEPGPGQKTRGFVESVQENPNIAPEAKVDIEGVYDVKSNKETMAKAKQAVNRNREKVINDLLATDVEKIKPEKLADLQARGIAAMIDAQKRKNYELEASLANRIAEIGTATGQASQILSVISKLSPEGMLKFVAREYQKANERKGFLNVPLSESLGKGKEKVELDTKTTKVIVEEMKKIQKMADGPEKQKAIQNLLDFTAQKIPPSFSELFDAFRYQNILSNPLTHLRNTYGNLMQVIFTRPITQTATASVDFMGSLLFGKPREYYFSEVPIYYKKAFDSLPIAASEFWDALKGNVSINQPDMRQLRSSRIPKSLTVIPRLLEASDRFFQTIVETGEYAALKERGLSDEVAAKQAHETATKYLFRNDIDPRGATGQGKVLSAFDKATQTAYHLRKMGLGWFIPFIKTPMNIAKAQYQYSPLGFTTMWGATNKKEQFAKAAIGSVVMSMGATMAAAGRTTWQAPADPKEKELFYASGRKPYSILIGGKWVPMQYAGVFALALAIPAAMKYYDQDNRTALTDSQVDKAVNIVGGLVKYYANTTYLTGLGNFMKMAEGDVDFALGPNMAFTFGQAIPLNGLVSYAARVLDPVYRKADSLSEGFQRNLPILSRGLEAYTAPDGSESQRGPSGVLMPYGLGTPNPAWDAMYKDRSAQLQTNNLVNKLKSGEGQNINIKNLLLNGGSITNKKQADELKKNTDDLMDTYFSTEDGAIRGNIQKTIESLGVNFNEVSYKHIMKDVEIDQRGLSESARGKLRRSNEFEYVRRLRNKFDMLGSAEGFVDNEMKRLNINQGELEYDDKTMLPDDVQLDEIHSIIDGLEGEDLFNTLGGMRRVSEGTRKPLLTDTLINDLKDEGIIDKNTANLLKKIGWDSKKKTFKLLSNQEAGLGGGGGANKSDFNLTGVDVPSVDYSTLKLPSSKAQSIIPEGGFKTKRISLSSLVPEYEPINYEEITGNKKGKISPYVAPMTSSLGGLGKL